MSRLDVVAAGLWLVLGASMLLRCGEAPKATATKPAYCTADTLNAVAPGIQRLSEESETMRLLAAEDGWRKDRHLRGTTADFAEDARLFGAVEAFARERLMECVR